MLAVEDAIAAEGKLLDHGYCGTSSHTSVTPERGNVATSTGSTSSSTVK